MASSTVASLQLKALRINNLLNMTFDGNTLFKRALKVFHVSYSAYRSMGAQIQNLYTQYFEEYCAQMTEVFRPNQPIPDIINQIETELKTERVFLRIGIIRAKNINSKMRPTVTVRPNIPNCQLVYEFLLDPTSEEQKEPPFSTDILFNDFVKLKTESKVCKISLTVDSKTETLDIPYRQIHAEGFTDWHNFSGVDVLIRIWTQNTESQPQNSQSLQLSSMSHIIQYRLSRLVDERRVIISRIMAKWHNSVATKRNIEPLQKLITPESTFAFWPKPVAEITEFFEKSLEQMRSELTFGRKAQYHDINIRLFEDLFEDNPFCVCTEWCNIGAFYYHNPVLRFYMTQHNLLYIRNPIIIPNLYLAIICHEMEFPNPANITFRPLFQLMKSTFDYCERRAERALRDANYNALLINNIPAIHMIIGATYILLRDRIHPKIAVMTSEMPFSDTSIENIRVYYKILDDLHLKISRVVSFIPPQHLSKWYNELETLSRKWYHNYIDNNFREILSGNQQLIQEDYLFSKVNEQQIEDNWNVWTPKIRQFEENPMNPKFANEPFLSCFIRLTKFIVNVEPSLQRPRAKENLKEECRFAIALDTMFCQLATTPNFIAKSCFAFITGAENMSLQRKTFLTLFYNLKIYSNVYRLQKYFFTYLTQLNIKAKGGARTKYIPVHIKFVFRNDWIDCTIAKIRPNEPNIFIIGSQNLQQLISNFYNQFWPKETHETQQNLPSDQLSDSVFNHYNRHYLWLKNGGNNKTIFINILRTFDQLINDCMQTTETIYISQILKNCKEFFESYEYTLEVIDHLVKYLITSVCYTIISIAANFLQPIHGLIRSQLVNTNQSFTLCKPGFVQLFKTSRICYKSIDRLKTYIVFDDEFDNISNTLSETRVYVKTMYRDFYRKLTVDWAIEVENIHNNWLPTSPAMDNKFADVMRLHLANGLSFLAAFVVDFRKDSIRIRNHLKKIFVLNAPITTTQTAFIHSWNVGQQYLQNRQEVDRGLPFESQIWTQLLQNIITRFDTKQLRDLNINLTNIT